MLITLGKPGGNRPASRPTRRRSIQPNDVITNASGDIFVVEGPRRATTCSGIVEVRQDRQVHQGDGQAWQRAGRVQSSRTRSPSTQRAGCSSPTASNNRIQIFDQDGNLLDTGWEQYSRISGLWIDKNDMLFAADSESGSVAPPRGDWKRGIRIGSIKDGRTARSSLHPGSDRAAGTSAAEGVAVDARATSTAPKWARALKKYVRRK